METKAALSVEGYLHTCFPDVSIFHLSEPAGSVPDTPPLIAIEILSADDRLAKVRKKLEEYHVWGVPHVWMVDPHSRRLYVRWGDTRSASLNVAELGVDVGPASVFE